MTTAEAAARLGTTRRAINAAIQRGRLGATARAETRGVVYDISEAQLSAYAASRSLGGRPKKEPTP